jgi:formiminotetrahydrofolate cyclodeaminase
MDYNFTENSCREFTDRLGSSDAVPGGGGASALAGALGAALGTMVANLTIPNPRYADVSDDMKRVREEMVELSGQLLACVQEDAVGFEPLSRAYGLPKNTEEEKLLRDQILEEALKKACEAPVRMLRLCAKAIDRQAFLAEKGGKLVISDAGTGAALLKSAMDGAILNVYVNTRLMKDRVYAGQLNRECERLMAQAEEQAVAVYASVKERLQNR